MGVGIDAKDNLGWTALIYSAFRGYIEITEILIDSGVDIDVKCDEGMTALMYATDTGHNEIVDLLKESGATE